MRADGSPSKLAQKETELFNLVCQQVRGRLRDVASVALVSSSEECEQKTDSEDASESDEDKDSKDDDDEAELEEPTLSDAEAFAFTDARIKIFRLFTRKGQKN